LTTFSRKNHSDIAITIVFLFRKMHRRKVGQLSPFAAKNNNQPSQERFGQSMTLSSPVSFLNRDADIIMKYV
jgi:hypothetical protein